MNTFAATMPAPRPAEALSVRGSAEAVEVPPEGAAAAFGAVLGALREGRPAKEGAAREGEGEDKAAATAAAETASSLPGLAAAVDPTLPPMPAVALDPAALQALIARAVFGTSPAAAGAAPGQAPLVPPAAGPAVSGAAPAVPAGVAQVAAGIALSIGTGGGVQVASPPEAEARTASAQGLPAPGAPGPGPSPGVEGRPQVTILRQETHFAPVKPRLVAASSPAISPAGPVGAVPVPPVAGATPPAPAAALSIPVAPPPMPVATASEAVPAGAATGSGAPAPAGPAAVAPVALAEPPEAEGAAAPSQTGVPTPPAGSLPGSAPAPEPSGRPRRAEATMAPATVASPAAQRLAGEAAPVEVVRPSPGEVPTAESGPRDAITPAATAPGGAPPSTAPFGEPARQVAEAVAAELSRPAGATGAAVPAPGTEGPLRLLTLQLRPMDLGTVLVRLRLRDGQLEMSLHASRDETAALLRQDSAVLTDLLRQSGYQPDSVTIGTGGAFPGENGRPGAGTPFQAGGHGGGQAQTGGHPDQAPRHRGDTNADERSDPTHERMHETTSPGPDRSGLYL